MARDATSTAETSKAKTIMPWDEEDVPLCLRSPSDGDLLFENLGLAMFLQGALPAAFRDASKDPYGDEDLDLAVQGFSIVMNLLVDRMAMAAGRSAVPTLSEIWRRARAERAGAE